MALFDYGMTGLRYTVTLATACLVASCSDSVPTASVPISAVTVFTPRDSLYIADTVVLTAEARGLSGGPLAGVSISWTSSAPAIMQVGPTGVVRVLAPGTAWIIGQADSLRDSVRLKGLARVARLVISPRSLLLPLSYSMTLSAVLFDASNGPITGRAITWRSLAPTVVDVGPGGGAIGRGRGTATIIAESEGRADTVILAGRLPVAVAQITAVPNTLTLGATRQLSALLLDSLGDTLTGVPVLWKSERALVAGVDSNGLVRAWGGGAASISVTADGAVRGRQTITAGDLVFAEVEAGSQFACGRTTAGNVLCWSHYITEPVLGNPRLIATDADSMYSPTLTAVPGSAVRLGSLLQYTACAVTAGSGTWCWGFNGSAQVGAPSAGPCSTVAGGSCRNGPVLVPGNQGFTAISAGTQHACALAADSTAWCWGDAGSGKLGDGNQFSGTLVPPTAVLGGRHFASIQAGANATCALGADSVAWCWGSGFGLTPVLVPGGLHLASLDAGTDFTCGITGSGAGYCWGSNSQRQLGAGVTVSSSAAPLPVTGGLSFTRISAGAGVACGVDVTQSLYCWGRRTNGNNRNGPVLVGAGYIAVTSGQNLACATAVGGRVYCWSPEDTDTPLLLPGQR